LRKKLTSVAPRLEVAAKAPCMSTSDLHANHHVAVWIYPPRTRVFQIQAETPSTRRRPPRPPPHRGVAPIATPPEETIRRTRSTSSTRCARARSARVLVLGPSNGEAAVSQLLHATTQARAATSSGRDRGIDPTDPQLAAYARRYFHGGPLDWPGSLIGAEPRSDCVFSREHTRRVPRDHALFIGAQRPAPLHACLRRPAPAPLPPASLRRLRSGVDRERSVREPAQECTPQHDSARSPDAPVNPIVSSPAIAAAKAPHALRAT